VEIIKLLKQRGTALTNANYEKANKLEEKIVEFKNQHLANLEKPVAAFITFET
jgi:hypothetical protein